MRFANVPMPQTHQRAPAADFLRRLIGMAPAAETAPGAATTPALIRPEDLPRDLDQRVRLVGEW